jgi:hypothetical protein
MAPHNLGLRPMLAYYAPAGLEGRTPERGAGGFFGGRLATERCAFINRCPLF